MFERAHHRRIAQVLHALDADALRSLGCLFGGGTAIDLAMMDLPPRRLRIAIDKARQAYGDAAGRDMLRSLETLRSRDQHLLRCIRALSITLPPAAILQKLRVLQRRVEAVGELRTGR